MNAVRVLPEPVKFLLVDDREENLTALAALLQREGLALLLARSGAEALELLLVHDVALAILDVQMPGMDGFELAELMRGAERSRNIPIIFVTAGATDKARVFRGYESGAVDFLFKPIDPFLLRCKTEVFFQLAVAHQNLKAAVLEREKTLRLNEMLLAVLGHDLRSPISSISMACELLQKRLGRGDKTIERIARGAGLMNRMIVDLLDYVRVREAGGLPVTPHPMDLLELTQRVASEHRLAHPGKQIEVKNLGGTLVGAWDEDRLAQLLTNLVNNAIGHGSAEGRVEVALDGTDPVTVKLWVRNQGSIPVELRDQLFTPFLEVKRKGREGLGLGLHIVQQIARSHGGDVSLEASGADETCFLVTIARRPQPA